jgi:anti-sigma factor RsiW
MPAATTTCPSTERLSALLDGDLPASEAAVVRAHAAGCARCAQAAAELGALVSAARGLDPLEPPPTLWRAVEGALDARAPAEPRGWLRWRPFLLGTFAGAIAVAIAVFALPRTAARIAERPAAATGEAGMAAAAASDPLLAEAEAEFARAAAAYEQSIEKLRTLLARAEQGWSADERTRIAERLARLDDAIERSRDFARRSPGDSAGNEQLFAAYQQKIAFLAAAVHRGGEWSERTP